MSPVNVPLVAVILPVICASEAVSCPLPFAQKAPLPSLIEDAVPDIVRLVLFNVASPATNEPPL